MLILNYNRRIQRPPFSALSPTTIPVSETMYQIGNPALKPTFTHDINISWVFGRKYSLNVGVQMQDGPMKQIYRRRGQSDIFELIFENMQPKSAARPANLTQRRGGNAKPAVPQPKTGCFAGQNAPF